MKTRRLKTAILSLSILLMNGWGMALALETYGPKKRVAIVDFENKTTYGQGRLGRAAADILSTELVKAKRFIVLERKELDKVLAEQKLGLSGIIDEKTAAKTGKVLGAQAVVTGAVSEFGEKLEKGGGLIKKRKQIVECTVDVRVVDATTGQVVYADSGKGEVELQTKHFLSTKSGYDETLAGKALRAAVTQVISHIIGQIETVQWRGRVAAIVGDRLYLNAGEKTGLALGTVLKVRGGGEKIIDPDTGIEIGETIGPEKGTVKTIEFCGKDCSVAQVIEGSGFHKGDFVTLVEGEE